jgi:allantoin racemase
MHALLINPNTSQTITDLVVAQARRLALPDVTITGVTGRLGARYIATRAAYAIAAHAALDAYAEHGAGADAILLACFGDPGLLALRELAPVPVVGMAEASCRLAARHGRFAIVTGGRAWVAMLEEFVAGLGLARHLASVRAVAPSGAEIARDPAGSRAMLAQECRAAAADGANVVILGGAGLVGIPDQIAGDVPVPLIDCLAAAMEAIAEATSSAAVPTVAPVESVGLGDRLAGLLAGKTTSMR